MSYLLAFAGFAALIILHELGHFAAAKAVGMRVERFALFFPPLLARWRPRDSETEYGIGAIPLGGYVKISGMNPDEELPPEVAPRAYFRQPVWKRVVVIGAGPLVNIVLAFVILWALFASRPMLYSQPVVDRVDGDSPASGVLRPGDRIVAVDGGAGYAAGLSAQAGEQRVLGLRDAITRHRCAGRAVDGCRATEPARIVVQRDGRRRTLSVTPRYDAAAGRMLVGFAFATRGVDVGVGEAARLSVTGMWNVTTTTVEQIVRVFFDARAREQVSGVVGSYEATRQTLEFDTVRAISILALISLSLGVINLFPFLPLDGGHIFWAIVEKVRRRPVPLPVMERAGVVGFMLVILLFLIGLSNDIDRLS
ncbi:MAG: M50 family metallopeptidase, partial [Vicinamibacteria bacterium]